MRIRRSFVEVDAGAWLTARHLLLEHEEGSEGLAVLFPGQNYGCEAPLLHYSRKAALLAGCDALSLVYRSPTPEGGSFAERLNPLTEEALLVIRRAIRPAHRSLLFVSKSMGTIVAGEVANRLGGLPVTHLFLTPVHATLPYLLQARGVVFTGMADAQFGEESLRQIQGLAGVQVVTIPHAGHSLELDEDVPGSLRILGQVCDACTGLAQGLG